MKTQDDKFWLVWSPTGARPPSFRHPTFRAASAEADRLAQAHPGSEFFVLGAETSCRISTLERVEYVEDPIPF